MNFLFVVFMLLAGAGILAYLRAPLSVATVAAGLGLLVLSQIGSGWLTWVVLAVAWLGWGGMLMLNHSGFRRRYLTATVFSYFRKVMPAMSATERDALEAGTTWWDAELFSGAPDWRMLDDVDLDLLSEREQAFLDGPVERLCGMVNEWEAGHVSGDLPETVWQYIKKEGFLGIIIPARYGGLEFSARAHSEIIQRIASRSGTAAVSCMVPNSLGPAELLLRYGTDSQKEHYLPRLASGQELPCFALTNPYAGSDAANIPDYGTVCEAEFNGETVLGMRVSWEKRYITLAPVASLLGLAFHLYDPDGLLGGEKDVGITLALVPTDHEGVEIGQRHYAARQPFQNGPTSGTDVFIPMDWVIGGRAHCGDGWRMLMNCLAAGRSISLPASSTAAIKVAAWSTAVYGKLRRQFNVPLYRFEGVAESMARIAANAYMVDGARKLTAAAIDKGEEPAVISALLKYQATERMRQSINDAMDIHGGRAVCDGPSNYLFHPYMATPVAITVEGANILTRSLIVFGQGAIRCHPWILQEIEATRLNDADGLAMFDQALLGHVGHVLTNAARSFVRNLTGGLLGSDPTVGETNYWYAQLERASASFALVVEGALAVLGGNLKRREMISGRFADVLGELYLMSAALRNFESGGRQQDELVIVEYALKEGLLVVQRRLDEIIENLPDRRAAWMLRRLVFPLGRRWRGADDRLTQRVAEAMAENPAVRTRLSAGIYVGEREDDLLGCLLDAANRGDACGPLLARVREAQDKGSIEPFETDLPAAAVTAGVLSETEGEQLRAYEIALRRAIDVDDFDAAALWARAGEPGSQADAA